MYRGNSWFVCFIFYSFSPNTDREIFTKLVCSALWTLLHRIIYPRFIKALFLVLHVVPWAAKWHKWAKWHSLELVLDVLLFIIPLEVAQIVFFLKKKISRCSYKTFKNANLKSLQILPPLGFDHLFRPMLRWRQVRGSYRKIRRRRQMFYHRLHFSWNLQLPFCGSR